MNDRQRTVVGIVAVALIIAALFFVPWRTAPEGEVAWAPVYRSPISQVRSYASELHDTDLRYGEGHVAFGLLVLELAGIGLLGWGAYVLSADAREEAPEEQAE